MTKSKKYYYLISFQYLGFRFHGWQKQLETYRTVQGMLERTIKFIIEHDNFKTLGASRTDAMVSAEKSLCKLTIDTELKETDEEFEHLLNKNLPADIKVLSFKETTKELLIITDSKMKQYHYYFCNEFKPSPFIAPFMTNFNEELDIEKMKIAAKMFEGEHNFSRYCYRPTEGKQYIRVIDKCEIVLNTEITASFFPEVTYLLNIEGKGFLRNQIRLMMGALVQVGTGKKSLESLEKSLIGEEFQLVSSMAPASGLMLKEIDLL
jgi:tRNA pseudouridine38-40 synthase